MKSTFAEHLAAEFRGFRTMSEPEASARLRAWFVDFASATDDNVEVAGRLAVERVSSLSSLPEPILAVMCCDRTISSVLEDISDNDLAMKQAAQACGLSADELGMAFHFLKVLVLSLEEAGGPRPRFVDR